MPHSLRRFLFSLAACFMLLVAAGSSVASAQEYIDIPITPQPCSGAWGCPTALQEAYAERGEACAVSLEDFQNNPVQKHIWIEDPAITAQGKTNERARQFIYWTLNTQSLDSSPIITNVWRISSNITYFLIAFVAAIMGVSLIIGQRIRFQSKLQVWPIIFKIGAILLYVALSAAILLFLVQISEILMKFFLEAVGGRDYFNIYFSSDPNEFLSVSAGGTQPVGASATGNSEYNYTQFVGCRDLNIRVQEGAQAEILLFKATNITYYVMGTMILLRKILLWFMIFVAPFAAVLIPFTFVRNVAWIWLGVFLQWLFYGPLFAMFLSATGIIWKQGIPFLFNFTKVDKLIGYVYPTAINITYGGPAQRLSALNNGNYVDTFAEYVITLIMLWACIIFPWWLLRIFRDYCCDYLMAMKNILLNMYDEMRTPPTGPTPPGQGPRPQPGAGSTITKLTDKITHEIQQGPEKTFTFTSEQIKQTETSQILRSMNVQATKLTDIARFETNTVEREQMNKTIQSLQNPMNAETPAQRQTFMTVRTELFNRALKDDKIAQKTLASVSNSVLEQKQQRVEIANSIKNTTNQLANQPVERAISMRIQVPESTLKSINNSIKEKVSQSESIIKTVTEKTNVAQPVVQQIFQTWNTNLNETPTNIVNNVTKNSTVNSQLNQTIAGDTQTVNNISQSTSMSQQQVQQILQSYNTSQSNSQAVQNVSNTTKVDSKQVQDIVNRYETVSTSQQTMSQEQIIQTISQQTSTPVSTIEKVVNTYNQQANNTVSTIATQTNTSQNVVQDVVNKYQTATANKQTINETQIAQTISQQTGAPVTTVQNIINSYKTNNSATTQSIAQQTNVDQKTVQDVINNYQNVRNQTTQKATDTTMIAQTIAQQTGMPVNTVQNVINTWKQQAVNTEENKIHSISQETHIDEKKVQNVVEQFQQAKQQRVKAVIKEIHQAAKKDKAVVSEIAKQHNVKEHDVEQLLEAQEATVATQESEPVEKRITLPQTVSIEDYEEVKKMWMKQYQSGEIPATENMQGRDEWVNHDIVFITNTLNKLTSEDQEMKEEGLSDVGYILPIFMINNFQGDELLVYLKAKLEAAKSVQDMLEREQEIKDKLAAKSDDLVEVDAAKPQEEEKTMTLEQSLELPKEGEDTDKPQELSATDEGAPSDELSQQAEGESAPTTEEPLSSDATDSEELVTNQPQTPQDTQEAAIPEPDSNTDEKQSS